MSGERRPEDGEQAKVSKHGHPQTSRDDHATQPQEAGVVAALLIVMVRLYQLTLSRYLGGQCRFVPTCSQYFIEAVGVRGPLVGTLMGLWRILRCNPFSQGGYDPVE